MTYDVLTLDIFSLENILIGGTFAAVCALVVAALATLSQMKQPDLRPIPIRVRSDFQRDHQRDHLRSRRNLR